MLWAIATHARCIMIMLSATGEVWHPCQLPGGVFWGLLIIAFSFKSNCRCLCESNFPNSTAVCKIQLSSSYCHYYSRSSIRRSSSPNDLDSAFKCRHNLTKRLASLGMVQQTLLYKFQ